VITRTSALSLAAAVAGLVALAAPAQAQSRDQLRIAGSSTVFPFSTLVAESFGKLGKFKTPVVESVGTGGGFKAFCAGVGPQHPDISNASRPITEGERQTCARNGVSEITEFTFGYDGISVAVNAKSKPFPVTLKTLWQAVAAEVPVNGKLEPNPYGKWSEIDKALPEVRIEIYGPSKNHGTRDAFTELVLDVGCLAFAEIKALPKDQQKKACTTVREDGAWIDVSEDYSLITGKLAASPSAVGVFTFFYIDQNKDKVSGLSVDGVAPTFDNIASKKYPVSRPLFFYVKNAHLKTIPGLAQYVNEFLSAKAAGEDGYLTAKGLIPMPAAELKKEQAKAAELLK
jgi:phosphate transport system substrate-binding protein